MTAGYAYADNVSSLNDKNVSEFVTNSSRFTSGNDKTISPDKLHNYLSKHLTEDAKFVTTVAFKIPNMPEQTQTIILDKNKLIDLSAQGASSIEGYNSRIDVQSVDISFWKKKAFVSTTNHETGFMAVPTKNGEKGETVPIESISKCTQIIVLNDKTIQLQNAVCDTKLTFKE
ncbi:MAG: hypothetical protein KTR28_04585 [Micavibrio sp.]|nr:hypothetical protein [Micavibrio sp.]